jgi:hypothetical protein
MQEALATVGITQEEYNMITKIREPLKKGLNCELRATKDDKINIYVVDKKRV